MNEMLKGVSTINWAEFERELERQGGLQELPESFRELLKRFFEVGHMTGQVATYDVMKDIYEKDVEQIVEIFEGE
jgi:hypothetical protein